MKRLVLICFIILGILLVTGCIGSNTPQEEQRVLPFQGTPVVNKGKTTVDQTANIIVKDQFGRIMQSNVLMLNNLKFDKEKLEITGDIKSNTGEAVVFYMILEDEDGFLGGNFRGTATALPTEVRTFRYVKIDREPVGHLKILILTNLGRIG